MGFLLYLFYFASAGAAVLAPVRVTSRRHNITAVSNSMICQAGKASAGVAGVTARRARGAGQHYDAAVVNFAGIKYPLKIYPGGMCKPVPRWALSATYNGLVDYRLAINPLWNRLSRA